MNAGDVRLLSELGLMAMAGILLGAGLAARRRGAPRTVAWGLLAIAALAALVALLVLTSPRA